MTGKLAAIAACVLATAAAFAEEHVRCLRHDPLRQPFFGDLHVHTTYSFDAWAQGTRNDPRDAYRFARGEAVGVQPYGPDGTPLRSVRLRRPLDFAMVSDHAELLGETALCRTPGTPAFDRLVCTLMRRWPLLGYMIVNSEWEGRDERRRDLCGPDGSACIEAARTPWAETQAAAEEHYDRTDACAFTTFVGLEWSGTQAGMIHRNVVFRNSIVPDTPPNAIDDGNDPARLWARLDRDCRHAGTGCDALAIPHNSNWSMGSMFRIEDLDPATARRRRHLEPLLEITQHKGDSECRSDSRDPLCGFETPDFGNLSGIGARFLRVPVPANVYAREGLAAGLRAWRRTGVDPLGFGFVGSTDTHLGTPGLVDEDAFVGHAAGTVSSRIEIPPLPDHPAFNPGGLAVLWAEENTRDALFRAMLRREAFGTSGPRIVVRVFGGWDLPGDLCDAHDFAARGYAMGVPMGAHLSAQPRSTAAPTFAVRAVQDAGVDEAPGAPLERVQIVKGWLDGDAYREEVLDVAGEPSDGGVDLDTCAPRAQGAAELCTVWRDPTFDPAAPAFYYARVVEVPTCRWSWRACRTLGVSCRGPLPPRGSLAACCDPDVPRTVQERAWASPIWYVPASLAERSARPHKP